ncbi:Aldehyde/histidinol dehydrogenase [Dendryphion nanum]|uniref:Aldehyde/histidinol dehydrogenase n=1 Tax=Dendryphion nanum TaxID=256645 RepID=A0A9P9IVF1_9PLEO|nr:Aldehyde/histidinol dehydrogenase [Dendryphion nanum]
MSTSSDSAIEGLRATAKTGKCENVFFRQTQLKFLHDVLRANSSQLETALEDDTSVSTAEAAAEVALSLSIVKEHYMSLDPKNELEREYRVAKNQDAIDRRKPWGVVYIEPQLKHTPLFSVISPLSASLAAGNVVAIKLEKNLRALPSLLRKLLPGALEQDTFATVPSSPSPEVLSSCLELLQDSTSSNPRYSQLASYTAPPVVAIVDRSADLPSAAQNLVTARFAFGGSSPYAPDIILVNEFIAKPFLELVLQNAIRFLATASRPNPARQNGTAHKSQDNVFRALTSIQENKDWKINIVSKGDAGAIIELTPTVSASGIPGKISQPIFAISTITSPDHAIDLLSQAEPPSAAYYFAEPSHAKYLDQFVASKVSFTNHIPAQLLLGPAAPLHQIFDLEKRYATEHFTRAAPAFVRSSVSQERLALALSRKDQHLAQVLLRDAAKEIKEAKRAEWIARGFFENGIFIGLGIYGVPILSCVGAAIFFGVRSGLRALGRI